MASIERSASAFHGFQQSKSSYHPRILGNPGIRTGMLITDIRKEPPTLNRPCSLFGNKQKTIVDRISSSPVLSTSPISKPKTPNSPEAKPKISNWQTSETKIATTPKRTPPPVPPRTSKTFSTPSPSKFVWTPGEDLLIDDKTPIAAEESPKKKKTPPPVPKKPTHLRLSAQRHVIPDSRKTPSNDAQMHMRLFALLLSPVTPTRINETVISSHVHSPKRHHRPLTAYSSTPHLDRILKDRTNFDDNNNSLKKSSVDESPKSQCVHRTTPKQQGRCARRKSLPLLAKNSNATTPTDNCQSESRSGVTSRCSSSFGAEQGSISSHDTPSSPPPPVPHKDYAQKDPICSKISESRDQMDGGEETESVVFFSTISTISSIGARDRSPDNGQDRRRENDSDKPIQKRSSRSHAVKKSNNLLNVFALEQSRRTVSVIERNARIIKWLYGCSNR